MPKISVILPIFNAKAYLKKAIDSIIDQTFADWELIIINDGSTDSSEQIVKGYTDERIRYYLNDHNLGLIETLNRGIELSTGEYIARMDADDVSHPDRLTIQSAFLDTNPDIAMCGTYARLVDEVGMDRGRIINLTDNNDLQVNLLFSVPFIHPSVLFRVFVLKLYMYNRSYKHAEDYKLWCSISDTHKIANIPHFLLQYRWHSTNVSVLNAQCQLDMKEVIIREQLNQIGLNPSAYQLYLHQVAFRQHDAKTAQYRPKFSDYDDLDKWFSLVIEANITHKKYATHVLISYLWARWIVLCVAQKKYRKIFKPYFVPLDIRIWIKTLQFLFFFSKK
ncbi:MAG: hypothetical protein RL662_2100 [Bacteroidota bacterium]|jgi:glycosyltransferase involved in cell wall biosynthesis